MDAEDRKTVAVNIAGRVIDVLVPTDGQLVGLQMLQSNKLPDGVKLEGLSELLLSLMPDEDARAWMALQMATGEHGIEDFEASVKAIATSPTAKPAKKTAAKPAARTRR